MKTYSPKPADIEHRWYVVDASGQVLGRLATEVATLLRGKHKPIYSPHMDTGDHVIVVNADKVELTGQKAEKKVAYRHSGYPGGIKGIRYTEYLATRPVAAVEKAVRGMLPHNRLGRQIIKKLHVVAGPEHPHQAQQPVAIGVGERPSWDGFPAPAPVEVPTSPTHEATPAAEGEPEQKASSAATAKKPTAKKPTAKAAAAKKPAAKKPTAKATAAKKPAAKKPAAKKPSAKTTAKKPATKQDEE